jgi:putative oxidoreductase
MKIASIIVRSLMGLLLLFASISFFFDLVPTPKLDGPTKMYNEGLAVVHLMPIVKFIELICGLLFVTGRFVTLAVLLIFPILFNIILFHAIVAPSGLLAGLFLMLGNLFLAYYYRRNYSSLFKMH